MSRLFGKVLFLDAMHAWSVPYHGFLCFKECPPDSVRFRHERSRTEPETLVDNLFLREKVLRNKMTHAPFYLPDVK